MTLDSQASGAICLQGHRGWRGKYPENSRIAFERALELGVSAIELDIVPGPDDTLWVWHDPFLGELFEGKHNTSTALFSYTQKDLKEAVFGLQAPPNFPRQQSYVCHLMQLNELMDWWLALGKDRVWLNIEIKSRPDWEPHFQPDLGRYVSNVRKALPESCDRIHIQSFDQRILVAMNALDPDCSLGWLTESRTDLKECIAHPIQLDALGIVNHLIDEKTVKAIDDLGMELMVWTLNDLDEVKRLFALGIRNFITDYPDLIRTWMDENGHELRRALLA